MKKLIVFLSWSIIVLNGSACQYFNPQKKTGTRRTILVTLFDNSGSFDPYINPALDHVIRYVEVLHGNDVFVLFLIDRDSLDRKEPPIFLALPRSKTTLVTRKYRQKIVQYKSRAIEQINELRSRKRARSTDIAGGISRAAQFLQNNQYTSFRKLLFIYSDMQDTVHRQLLNAQLDDVCVKILFADYNEKTKIKKKKWSSTLKELGARGVEIWTPDNCIAQTEFKLECEGNHEM